MEEVKNLTEQYNKEQASKILACYGVEISKSEENDLEKSEGSRGGKVIGHTKSGKAIYDSFDHPKHKDFTAEDHWDAAETSSSHNLKQCSLHDKKQYDMRAKKILDDARADLEKGGEGSKGGKIIGHTKSGKPIYDSFEHEGHRDFTTEDHRDAAEHNFHHKYENYNKHDTQEQFKHHSKQSILHDKKHWDMKAKDMLKTLDDKVEKSEENDIEKGGVGSGRKVGITSSGKDIYDTHNHEEHKNFNEKEHEEAADYHKKESLKHRDSQKENDKKIDSLNRDEIFSKKHKELEDKDKEISDKIKHHESNYYSHIDSANKQYKNK